MAEFRGSTHHDRAEFSCQHKVADVFVAIGHEASKGAQGHEASRVVFTPDRNTVISRISDFAVAVPFASAGSVAIDEQ
jgi:hypothetical protein